MKDFTMKPTYKQKISADFFNGLAHPRRQMLFQILREYGAAGMPFHSLLSRSGFTPSTLAFHISKMAKGHIVKRKIKGAETWLILNKSSFDLYYTSMH
ncbi:MAG: hypothetical protein V3V13_12030 [Paracoccaceae bacterium]